MFAEKHWQGSKRKFRSTRFRDRSLTRILIGVSVLVMAYLCALPQAATATDSDPRPVAPVPNPCVRSRAGSVVEQPPALSSSNGVLNVRFSYQQTTDSVGRLLHCFMTEEGLESPTLPVKPGDTLNITVTNNTPASPLGEFYNPLNAATPPSRPHPRLTESTALVTR
jgi:hypothetical protein